MVQFTKRKLGANEVHKIGDMKSLVWWGGGRGGGRGREGGRDGGREGGGIYS